ncbi:hypothetical protein Pyn_34967 [Prunus yedoensis var. nudiflora]|uniref:Uncharacterized protein n=1 Tax=Prunus yedoensis var. nudiflora TaxID=2094558 RepID=A0A314ULZ1_PRUYE|nr:hypothetical protein Pyn_34967 [Prunus yedoensis var. nudiflora]
MQDPQRKAVYIPLQASTKERNAKTESTRTGSYGSRIPATTLCNALRKLFESEKLIWAYCPATQAA